MKIVFHERCREVYSSDWASKKGRLDSAYHELCGAFEFTEPGPAQEKDLLLIHSPAHLEKMKQAGTAYEIALLAAGGAIKAAHLAVSGEKAFALVRPPGHHARADCKWGFCIFNNVAIAVENVRRRKSVKKALIIDIDLHFGDGTSRIFHNHPDVVYHHVSGSQREEFLAGLEGFLKTQGSCDVIAVSAGFDTHEYDWGFMLKTGDYNRIGRAIGEYAGRVCQGKVFGVLEGGYNHHYLGRNIKSFLMGLEGREYIIEDDSTPPVFI